MPHIQRYLAIHKANLGPTSDEVICGLGLLSLAVKGLNRAEEAFSVMTELFLAVDQVGRPQERDALLDGLKRLAEKYQSGNDPVDLRRAFVSWLMTLSWCVRIFWGSGAIYEEFLPYLSSGCEDFGIGENNWEWLVRRSSQSETDFVGLVSVLIEERMCPPQVAQGNRAHDSELDEDTKLQRYEIVGIDREHWTPDAGFSKSFPVSVAKGELSLRVERLLEEGRRCLCTTGELRPVFLVFSPKSTGTLITGFSFTTWSPTERVLTEKNLRQVIGENGAASAMMLAWLELPNKDKAEFHAGPTEVVMVVARDEHSYLFGLQQVRLVGGKYTFEEPQVIYTGDTLFTEFSFPVRPGSTAKKRTSGKKKPE